MPCRCDGYETGEDDEETEDLTHRLCRSQSVVKDLLEFCVEFMGCKAPSELSIRAMVEIKELKKHKAAEEKKNKRKKSSKRRLIK